MQRQGSRYDRETKAQALSLALQSNATSAARELGLSSRTVERWVQHYTADNADNNEWMTENALVIARSTALTLDGLDIVESKREADRHLMALNAIRGTAIDKVLKHSAPDASTAINVFVGVKVD